MYGVQINNTVVSYNDNEFLPRLVRFNGLMFILIEEVDQTATIMSITTLSTHSVDINQIQPFHGTVILTQ